MRRNFSFLYPALVHVQQSTMYFRKRVEIHSRDSIKQFNLSYFNFQILRFFFSFFLSEEKESEEVNKSNRASNLSSINLTQQPVKINAILRENYLFGINP